MARLRQPQPSGPDAGAVNSASYKRATSLLKDTPEDLEHEAIPTDRKSPALQVPQAEETTTWSITDQTKSQLQEQAAVAAQLLQEDAMEHGDTATNTSAQVHLGSPATEDSVDQGAIAAAGVLNQHALATPTTSSQRRFANPATALALAAAQRASQRKRKRSTDDADAAEGHSPVVAGHSAKQSMPGVDGQYLLRAKAEEADHGVNAAQLHTAREHQKKRAKKLPFAILRKKAAVMPGVETLDAVTQLEQAASGAAAEEGDLSEHDAFQPDTPASKAKDSTPRKKRVNRLENEMKAILPPTPTKTAPQTRASRKSPLPDTKDKEWGKRVEDTVTSATSTPRRQPGRRSTKTFKESTTKRSGPAPSAHGAKRTIKRTQPEGRESYRAARKTYKSRRASRGDRDEEVEAQQNEREAERQDDEVPQPEAPRSRRQETKVPKGRPRKGQKKRPTAPSRIRTTRATRQNHIDDDDELMDGHDQESDDFPKREAQSPLFVPDRESTAEDQSAEAEAGDEAEAGVEVEVEAEADARDDHTPDDASISEAESAASESSVPSSTVSHLPPLLHQEEKFLSIFSQLKKIGVQTRNGERIRHQVSLKTEQITRFVQVVAEASALFKGLRGDDDGENREETGSSSDRMGALLSDIERDIRSCNESSVEEGTRREMKQDIYAHGIPSLVRLLKAALRYHQSTDDFSVGSPAFLQVLDIMDLALALGEKVYRWKVRLGPSIPVIKAVRNGILVPLREIRAIFNDALETYLKKQRLRENRQTETRLRQAREEQELRETAKERRLIAMKRKKVIGNVRRMNRKLGLHPITGEPIYPSLSSGITSSMPLSSIIPRHHLSRSSPPRTHPVGHSSQQLNDHSSQISVEADAYPPPPPNNPAKPWSTSEIHALIYGLEAYTGADRYKQILERYGGDLQSLRSLHPAPRAREPEKRREGRGAGNGGGGANGGNVLRERTVEELYQKAREVRADLVADADMYGKGEAGLPRWLLSV
ncbi:MAG: hypothetical protein M1817_003194 [Caeruleum heppii]|nr:MAG: hypothetical protein M1817_003194 [Caeruleum heppii]